MALDVMDRIDAEAPAFKRMQVAWKLIDRLKGGTPAMREAREDLLPRNERESLLDYDKRMSMSYLHPGFTGAVKRVVSKACARQVVVQNEHLLGPRLQALVKNTDGHGKSLHQLVRDLMDDGCERGQFHIAVDLPPSTAQTRADELRVMPRMFRIHPPNLFAFPYESQTAGGPEQLMQVRFRECVTRPSGQWGFEERKQIRVWNAPRDGQAGSWELYEEGTATSASDWARVDGGTLSFKGGIPIETGYFKRVGFMESESPFEDVAWLNLAHWQSSSRQRWLLEFARLPFIFGSGWADKEVKTGITLTPTKAVLSTNSQAKLGIVEHTGSAIGSGQSDLDDLERRMEESGMKPMLTKSGTPTAAQRWLDEATVQTEAQGWVVETETRVTNALRMAGEIIGERVPDKVSVNIPAEMVVRRDETQVPHLIAMRTQRWITLRMLLEEMKDRGVIRDTWDVDDIIEELKEESPDEAMLSGAGIRGEMDRESMREEQDREPEGKSAGAAAREKGAT